ncbi:hypothetical protein Tco_0028572, partial [Tanacetum coccineum]
MVFFYSNIFILDATTLRCIEDPIIPCIAPRLCPSGISSVKTNDESGTPHSQSGWKTSWAKKDDKEDQCASRVVDSSNTNQWGKKEAGSSPSSSGKWAA